MRREIKIPAFAFAALLAALLSGCGGGPSPAPGPAPVAPPAAAGKLTLAPVDFGALPGWSEDRVAMAVPPLLKSCARRLSQPTDATVGPEGIGGRVSDWRGP